MLIVKNQGPGCFHADSLSGSGKWGCEMVLMPRTKQKGILSEP